MSPALPIIATVEVYAQLQPANSSWRLEAVTNPYVCTVLKIAPNTAFFNSTMVGFNTLHVISSTVKTPFILIGTITCVEFFHQGFLFSGSDDGNICVWNTKTWNCEKTLKAHAGGVTALSIHPSGKLALSVGKDRAMKTWNLIKGRTAYVTNIKAVADAVKWSPEGTVWGVCINTIANIYEVKSAGIKHTVDFKSRINFILFLDVSLCELY